MTLLHSFLWHSVFSQRENVLLVSFFFSSLNVMLFVAHAELWQCVLTVCVFFTHVVHYLNIIWLLLSVLYFHIETCFQIQPGLSASTLFSWFQATANPEDMYFLSCHALPSFDYFSPPDDSLKRMIFHVAWPWSWVGVIVKRWQQRRLM